MRKFHWTTAWTSLAFALATAANAQPPGRFRLGIPGEALAQAVRDIAVSTRRNVIAPADLIEARRSKPLSGEFTAEEALAELLDGTA